MENKVLVDSDAFVGWIVATDTHHLRASEIFERLKVARITPITTNLVIAETASLLSRRNSNAQAKAFLEMSQHIETVYITEYIHQMTVNLFLAQTREHSSFVDLANVVVAQEYGMNTILSFDKVYARDFNLKLAA